MVFSKPIMSNYHLDRNFFDSFQILIKRLNYLVCHFSVLYSISHLYLPLKTFLGIMIQLL